MAEHARHAVAVRTATDAPARWVSQLAEDCAFHIEEHRYDEMQRRVRNEAHLHGLAYMTVAKMVGQEWDRLGIVRVGRYFPGTAGW